MSILERRFSETERAEIKRDIAGMKSVHEARRPKGTPSDDSVSGLMYVYYNRPRDNYRVFVMHEGKQVYAGTVKDVNEAPDMQWRKEKELRGGKG